MDKSAIVDALEIHRKEMIYYINDTTDALIADILRADPNLLLGRNIPTLEQAQDPLHEEA